MNVNLHIERLVLEGFALSGRDAAVVEEALRAELVRLFAGDRTLAHSMTSVAMPSAQGALLHVSGAERPPQLGAAIAQSVHGVIAR
ncbi:MAG: hypothetical protein QOF32_70 [Gammaproteobacteria bacterium]|jgi:hypothetical protein|nr:hypothetical protein [Gammaproteobacteria bacterium]